jgi:hypothetical protein
MTRYLSFLGVCVVVGMIGGIALAADETRRPTRLRGVSTRPAEVPATRPFIRREPRRLGPPQPTHVYCDVFRVTLPYEKGAEFSLEQVRGYSSSAKALLDALSRLGETVLMYRFEETIDLAGETTLSKGQQEPIVRSVVIGPRGVPQPTVDYLDNSCRLTILGQWGGDQRSDREADISVDLRLKYVESSSVSLGGDARAPLIVAVGSERSLRATSRKAVLSAFFSPEEPQGMPQSGEKTPRQFRVCIVRLQLDRLQAE